MHIFLFPCSLSQIALLFLCLSGKGEKMKRKMLELLLRSGLKAFSCSAPCPVVPLSFFFWAGVKTVSVGTEGPAFPGVRSHSCLNSWLATENKTFSLQTFTCGWFKSSMGHVIVIPPKRSTMSPAETSKLTYLKCTGGSPGLAKPHSFAQATYCTWDFQPVQILCCEEICTADIQPVTNSRQWY